MGATYRKNPVTLAAVNPGKPPKAKKAKGGKSMTAKKKKSKARKSSAASRRAKARPRYKTGPKKGQFKPTGGAKKSSAKRKSTKRKTPAKVAARKAVSAKRKSKAKKRTSKQIAAAKRNIKKAQAARKRKASLGRRFNKAAATKKKSPKRKSSRKMPPRYKSGPKKGQFKPRSARKAPKGRVTSASKAKRPKGAPSRNAKTGRFTSRPRLSGAAAKKGRPRPGWYPISGYKVEDHWGWRQNPKIMPNGTILDPQTKKFVSRNSARGRALLGGGGGGMGSWLSNPIASVKSGVMEYGDTMRVAMQQAIGLSAGFFGARALANYVSMASWTSRLPSWMVPYAPFLAQLTASGAIFMAGQKIDRVRPYQASAMAGVGVSIIEAIVNRFAPAQIREYAGVPDPGLGDSLDVYRRALGEGLDEGWYDYRSGDANLLGEYVTNEDLDPVYDIDGGMGEYVLDEDLDPAFDLGEYVLEEDLPEDLGEYVTMDELDPVFDAVGDSSTAYDEVQARAANQVAMGEYLTPESLEEDFDIFGGVGDVTAASLRARDQIMMGDDQQDAIITNVHGPAVSAGMFGGGSTAKQQTAMALATTAVQAAKASGASPKLATKQAIKAVRAGAKIPFSQAKVIVGQAIRNAMSTKHQGVAQPAPMPTTPAAPELLPEEPDASEFKQGIFSEGMFDPSDDE